MISAKIDENEKLAGYKNKAAETAQAAASAAS